MWEGTYVVSLNGATFRIIRYELLLDKKVWCSEELPVSNDVYVEE
jgi:hypothetical protein